VTTIDLNPSGARPVSSLLASGCWSPIAASRARIRHRRLNPVAADPSHPAAFGVVDRLAVDGEAHASADALVVNGPLRVLKPGNSSHQEPRLLAPASVSGSLDPIDQLARHQIDNVGFAASSMATRVAASGTANDLKF